MRHQAWLLTACALLACEPADSTIDYEAPIDDERSTASLSQDEIGALCESVRAVELAHAERLAELTCKSLAAFALSSEQCLEVHAECMAIHPLELTCESERVAPTEQPLCNEMTVGQVEDGMEGYFNVDIPESIEEICALDAEERALIGDLGRLGVSEADIDGYNCAVNSTLTPVGHADPEACWELSFGTLCL